MTQGKKVTTLVIHAPDYRVKDGAKGFEAVLADGIGKEYAISRKDKSRLLPNSSVVVLLRKDKNKRRAEGRFSKLVETDKKTPQRIKQYDVHFKDRKVVTYKPEKLNRFGVAVIESDC